MLSMLDVLDYCDLNRGEIEAIAEHEHIPLTIAAEMGEMLLCSPEGVCQVHAMIVENMTAALNAGEFERVILLNETYKHLQRTHPMPEEEN